MPVRRVVARGGVRVPVLVACRTGCQRHRTGLLEVGACIPLAFSAWEQWRSVDGDHGTSGRSRTAFGHGAAKSARLQVPTPGTRGRPRMSRFRKELSRAAHVDVTPQRTYVTDDQTSPGGLLLTRKRDIPDTLITQRSQNHATTMNRTGSGDFTSIAVRKPAVHVRVPADENGLTPSDARARGRRGERRAAGRARPIASAR